MLDWYNEEQFRKMYHNNEPDFVLSGNHLSPKGESPKPYLFMQPITNPVGNIWYNKVCRVGRDTAANWLRNM